MNQLITSSDVLYWTCFSAIFSEHWTRHGAVTFTVFKSIDFNRLTLTASEGLNWSMPECRLNTRRVRTTKGGGMVWIFSIWGSSIFCNLPKTKGNVENNWTETLLIKQLFDQAQPTWHWRDLPDLQVKVKDIINAIVKAAVKMSHNVFYGAIKL